MAKQPAKKGPGRPPGPDKEAGRFPLYLSKRFREPLGQLARQNYRTMRAEVERLIALALKDAKIPYEEAAGGD